MQNETSDQSRSLRPAFLLPVRSIIFILVSVIGTAVTGKALADIGSWWSLTATAVNLVMILAFIIYSKKTGISFSLFMTDYPVMLKRRRDEAATLKKTALLVLAFAAVGMGGMYLSGLICYGSIMPRVTLDIVAPITPALAVINFILLPATVSFAEDGLYLGCGVRSIGNKYAAVIIPAFFYALQHCFIPTYADAKYMIYRFLSFLPLTVIFCIHYRRHRDPVPIMISHALLDLATSSLILMTSVSPEIYEKMQEMMK